MVTDMQLGVAMNFLALGVMVLVAAYHYVAVDKLD